MYAKSLPAAGRTTDIHHYSGSAYELLSRILTHTHHSQVKRHKASSTSTLNSNNNNPFPVPHRDDSSSPLAPAGTIPNEVLDIPTTTKAELDRALLHTHLLPRSLPKRRRSSVAVMSSTLAVPPAFIPLESVGFNVTDPSLADMNRKRRTSWSYIVGNCDSRSIDTGLNELDRITGIYYV